MKVYFHEIKDQELSYSFTEATPWVMDVVGQLDERIDRIQRPPNWKPRSRPTELSFTLRRVDDLVHVSGKVKTQLYMLCSLCADAFQFPIQTQFHVLLTQSPQYAETPRESSRKNHLDLDPFEDEPEDDFDDEEDDDGPANLEASDFEVTVVEEPVANLAEIFNEQMVLIIPMQPKPPKDEKGDCTKCGRKQLAMKIEAAEPLHENPFAVLKNFGKK